MLNVEQVKELLTIVNELADGEFTAYVAGGYLRDTLNGIQPKDIDIMVVPTGYGDAWDFESLVVDELYGYRTTKLLLDECQYMSDMKKRGVCGLFMGNYKDIEVQFIVYNRALTQEEVTLDMDINLCQITMGADGIVIESDNFVTGFADSVISLHHEYSEKREKERLDRMLAKYPTFSVRGFHLD